MCDDLERYGPRAWSSNIVNQPKDADIGVWITTVHKIA